MQVSIVGIGVGHPDHLTNEAVQALASADIAVAMKKREDDPLVAERRRILDYYVPDLQLLQVDDPPRDRSTESTSTDSGYRHAVNDWHEARAAAVEQVLLDRGPDDRIALLVWGDPSFYDSTIRIVERILDRGNVTFSWDVVPGISALQLLAARHRIVLHEVGQPILVTTGRRLREAIDAGAENILVMLSASVDLTGLDDWHVWWGANLGTDSEYLITGRVGEAAVGITAARERVKAESGWVMDVYLLRRPTGHISGGTASSSSTR